MDISPHSITRNIAASVSRVPIVINVRMYYTDDTVYAEASFTLNSRDYICSNVSAKHLAVVQSQEITDAQEDALEHTVTIKTDNLSCLFVSWK